MAIDIHLYVEHRRDGSSPWVGARKVNSTRTEPIYATPNYTLFEILGFPTGSPGATGIEPITVPRGLPDDVSVEVRLLSLSAGDEAGGHSWLTLEELQGYDWGKYLTVEGVLTRDEYASLLKSGKAPSWKSDVFGANFVLVPHEQILTLPPSDGKVFCTRVAWEVPCRERCEDFLARVIPFMEDIGPGPEHERIVYWFTS
ncbi:MAG: hypothetical protein HYY93_02045 [Planctomycetes bacterium]|nr:hypothetical protein [Planctomycetota bacterium]